MMLIECRLTDLTGLNQLCMWMMYIRNGIIDTKYSE